MNPFLIHPDNKNNYLSDPDVLLMVEFQRGNKASFETLMRKYYARILNFIYRFVGNREIAEDLTQEVFLRVYKSSGRYYPQAKFQTWIFTIAKNVSLNEVRRKRKTISIDQEYGQDGEHKKFQLPDNKILGPDKEMIKQEKVVEVRKAINSLPANQRTAVILRRYEDFSYSDIAKTLGCSVEAVKSLLSRAKEALKNRLKKYVVQEETDRNYY